VLTDLLFNRLIRLKFRFRESVKEMKKEILPELFKKYLQGECTPEESAFIDKWYLSHEENPDDARLFNVSEREKLERKMLDRIKANVLPSQNHLDGQEGKSNSLFFKRLYQVAASIVLLALIGIAAFFYRSRESAVSENQTASAVNKIKTFTNNTKLVTHQLLSDGTVIKLQPHGSIEFPEVFSAPTREIHLTGEAFFDVAKDKNRPFIITTGDVTIRVLGTSFNVRAYEGSKEITIAVKTGRVSVYAKNDPQTSNRKTKEEIILTPNQEVVYNTINENFSKKLVDEPQIILEKSTLFEMRYDGTPVDKIFKVLEENYGIDIVFDEQVLSGCSLTTSMAEEGLYERIEIICEAIGAQYEIGDAMILIKSTGCQ